MKRKSRRAARAVAVAGVGADRVKSMFKDGLMVTAGLGLATLVTYKVWNGYDWIDSKVTSGIGRGLAKSAMSVTAALAYAYLVPSMPLIAAGIAAYGIFMGGMDILGIQDTGRQLPPGSLVIPLRFASIQERATFLSERPAISAADRVTVMARPVGPALVIPERFATEAARTAFLDANPTMSVTDRAAVLLRPTGPAAMAYRLQAFQTRYQPRIFIGDRIGG